MRENVGYKEDPRPGLTASSPRSITNTILESIDRVSSLIEGERETERLLSKLQDSNTDNIKLPETPTKDVYNETTSIFDLVLHLNILIVKLCDLKTSNINHLVQITAR